MIKKDASWLSVSRLSVIATILAVFFSIGGFFILLLERNKLLYSNTIENIIIWTSPLFIILAISFLLVLFKGIKELPIAHMVAFIGYPRSGKTTLITSLFSEIFAQRILRGVDIIPRGEETIKRVNEDIARLEMGRELNATTDQDLFNYRVEMLTGRSFLSRRYKIEIGDFPGEDSENLSNKEPDWLHSTKYFQWALNADAFIFVIDLEYLSDLESNRAMEYKSIITSSFRAAWQKLKEHHYDGARRLRDNAVVIAFTKADLLFGSGNAGLADNMMALATALSSYQRSRNTGLADNMEEGSANKPKNYNKPAIVDSREKAMVEKEKEIQAYFHDIIEYLDSETKRFEVVFTSVFAKEKADGARFGMDRLARCVLPR
uniref:50S ribosome-binding GTPase n=1 Tax=Candidatus Kentrum sp. FW TaxID=2126338 RepID=A0A450TGP7_9GAMM|nr:MAG: 50S ribosome-binding GTPase [Candidatus Kentron sp. FW]